MWNDIQCFKSSNENVKKYVFTNEKTVAESVLYKYNSYEERTVICCSVMSGCPVGCTFCGTGEFFIKALSADDIIQQVTHCFNDNNIKPENCKKVQIMLMSMGEPLLNLKNVIPAINEMSILYPNADMLISTIGPVVDYSLFFDLAKNNSKVGLQFSVHESTDEARNKLIPFKAKHTLEELSHIGQDFYTLTGRKPFFNYCAHLDNTTQDDVNRLSDLFDPTVFECTISVICAKNESVHEALKRQDYLAYEFSEKMLKAGYNVRTFDPAGQDDIGGGCGQLRYVQDWVVNNPEKVIFHKK